MKNFKALTAYRFIAAMIVVIVHYQTFILFPLFPELLKSPIWMNVFSSAPPIVDFFFLLSGFIMAHCYWSFSWGAGLTGYWKFMKVRFARVYPMHLFTLLLMCALFIALHLLGKNDQWFWKYSVNNLVANLFLVQDWETTKDLTFNRPAWSISSEWAAYLVFPALIFCVKRVRGAWLAGAVALVLWAFLIGLLYRAGYHSLDRTYHLGLLRIAADFPAGMLLYQVYRATQSRASLHLSLFALSILGLVISAFCGRVDPFSVPFFAVLIVSTAVLDDHLTFFHSDFFQKWGTTSYAIYMCHHFFIRAGFSIYPLNDGAHWPFMIRLAIPIIYVAVTLAFSRLLCVKLA